MVASEGPPCVNSQTCSKEFAVQIEDKQGRDDHYSGGCPAK